MLTSKVWSDISAAEQYYPHLSQDDFSYYLENYIAHFHGKIAERIGHHGKEVTAERFSSFLHAIDFETGQKFRVKNMKGARVGIDLCANVPKSVSVVHALTNDPAILEAIEYGNTQMMKVIETYAQYQQNTKTQRNYFYSKQLLWSSHLHKNTRPNKVTMPDGKVVVAPDCHLHFHNFLNSFTWNEDKQRYQALEVLEIFRRLPYFEKTFHSIVSKRLQDSGYQIDRSENGFYELAGVSKSIIQRFSNRTQSIEKFASDKSITDPKIKGELGSKLRLGKNASTVKEEDLKDHWASRLTKKELETIQTLKGKTFERGKPLSLKECVDRAISHHLEREAAAPTERVLATAMTYGYGSYLPDDFRRELNSKDNILQREIEGMNYLTTEEMRLAEEKLIMLAINGKGKCPTINAHYSPEPGHLNTQQANAVNAILKSTDRTMALKGSAGVGKSYLLKSVGEGVAQAGKSLYAVTPSTQAAKVLSDENFNATTVAALLHNPKLQEKLRNQVLILDEAGQCGLKDMTKILALAEKYNTRTILSGDTKQHNPVGQDAMRLLETQSQIQSVTVNKIMRQKPEAYKAAVQKLAVGRTMEGYQDLDKKLSAIKEEPDHDKRLNQIAEDYIASVSKGRSALIVSPTNYEGQILNEVVRDKLKTSGKIKGKERSFERLINMSFTESQKLDVVNYSENMVVRFLKNQKSGLYAGSHHEVIPSKDNQGISIRDLKSGKIQKLPIENTKHFDVFQKAKAPLAQGDLIRLTQNIRTGQTKLNNGNTYTVKRLNKNSITLNNGKTIPNDAYHWKHGYTETSHSSQGKTKDDVFISMSDMSFAAVNEQTLYVAASRGKYSARIYTSSKDDLKRAVARSGVRVTAREVAEGHEQRLLQQKQQAHHRALNEKIRENERIQERGKTATRSLS